MDIEISISSPFKSPVSETEECDETSSDSSHSEDDASSSHDEEESCAESIGIDDPFPFDEDYALFDLSHDESELLYSSCSVSISFAIYMVLQLGH